MSDGLRQARFNTFAGTKMDLIEVCAFLQNAMTHILGTGEKTAIDEAWDIIYDAYRQRIVELKGQI